MDGANEMMCGLDYADSMFDYKNKYVLKVYLHNRTQYCLIVSFVSRQARTRESGSNWNRSIEEHKQL